MKAAKLNASSKPSSQPKAVLRRTDPLEKLSEETGKSVETLRMFAKISDPTNAHLFKAEAAYKAFAGVRIKR